MSKPIRNTVDTGRTQRGAVLIVSLVMLLLLTFIGVAAMNTSNTQEKMVGNLQDQQVAFEMAELALQEGEQWLLTMSGLPDSSTDPSPGDDFVWSRDAIKDKIAAPKASWWEYATDSNFWTAEGNAVDLDTALIRSGSTDTSWFVYQEPQYVIEELQNISGAGGSGNASIGMSDGSVSSTIFRIVARGIGGRQDTVVMLEGIYGKQ